MRLPYRLQGQKVKSQGGAGAYCGGHLAAQLVRDCMSFVSNDKLVEKNYGSMRLEELRKELKARNAKVSGRKHELMDRCVLFIRMTSCRARVSLFDEEKV